MIAATIVVVIAVLVVVAADVEVVDVISVGDVATFRKKLLLLF